MSKQKSKAASEFFPPHTLAIYEEIQAGHLRHRKTIPVAGATAGIKQGQDSLWVLLELPGGGGIALRTACSPGAPLDPPTLIETENGWEFCTRSAVGDWRVRVEAPAGQPLLHSRVWLTPKENFIPADWLRDLYVFKANGSPAEAAGIVHAAQRGLNGGLLFLSLDQPASGSLLYLQNFTTLNDYFEATGTIPDGVVGGKWPELGYQPPASEDKPLPAGRETVFSDVFLRWTPGQPQDTRQTARVFLDLLAGIYPALDRPESLYHDWPQRATETLRDLDASPDATIAHYGHRYLHPYTAAEYPDSMVQLTVLLPLREFADWKGSPIPLAEELRGGMGKFFDPKLGTVRRYLPNVGKDKDADEVDSWYLYHPLANLGRLAAAGDEDAREMFLRSCEYGIKVARHFQYQFPVQFNASTLEVIVGQRKPGEPGQSDAGGLYAYVMLQAHGLTGKQRYLAEAEKAIQATKDMQFELEYQANITAWGATACLRLWKLTGEVFYREQSFVFLAGFFHNMILWESEIKAAKHYPVFLGVTCLHDGPYMALYECFESYCSFHEYLAWGNEVLPDSVRLLLTEYIKYTLSRAWYYYPKELPADILATEVRNGHIARTLALPLEDLYADGQPAGQVGQEIYGSGAAFAFTTRSFHRLGNAPFLLFCEYPIFDLEQTEEPCVSFRVRGLAALACRARLIPTDRKHLPDIQIHNAKGSVSSRKTEEGHREFTVSGGDEVEIRWR